MESKDSKYCCICGKSFSGYGNNPYPVVKEENARCCDDCNRDIVIPARIIALALNSKKQ